MLHKRDEHAVARLGPPRTTRARCSAAAPTTRSRPTRTRCGTSDVPAAEAERPPTHVDVRRADRRRARRPRRARPKGDRGRSRATSSRSPTSTRCCSPGARRRAAGHQARPHPLLRDDRAGCCSPTSPTGRSTCTGSPTASTRQGFWQKQLPPHAPGLDHRGGTTTDADAGETEEYLVADSPADAGLARQPTARSSCTRGRRAPRGPPPDLRADRHRPGHRDDLGRRARPRPPATAPRSSTSACAAYPKVTGQRGIQIWIPIAPGLTFDDTRGWVEQLSRAVGATVPELVSWKWEKDRRGGPRPPRLHAERDQQDAGRAVQRRGRAPARRSRCRSRGTSSTIPSSARTAGRSAPSLDRVAEAGDPLAPLLGVRAETPRPYSGYTLGIKSGHKEGAGRRNQGASRWAQSAPGPGA